MPSGRWARKGRAWAEIRDIPLAPGTPAGPGGDRLASYSAASTMTKTSRKKEEASDAGRDRTKQCPRPGSRQQGDDVRSRLRLRPEHVAACGARFREGLQDGRVRPRGRRQLRSVGVRPEQ